jgi:hypothetical protein
MNFFIFWTALGQYEWVENWYEDEGPHGYAWGHKNYGKSNYTFLLADKYPEEFEHTPEDDLLNSIFGKQERPN